MEKVTSCLCHSQGGFGSKDLKDSLGRFSDDDDDVVSCGGTVKKCSLSSSDFCPHRVDFTSSASVEGSELAGICLAHISRDSLFSGRSFVFK